MTSVTVRWMRAPNLVWLDAHHAEQLLGTGVHGTAVWPGLLGEALCLERVTVSGAGTRQVPVRLVLQDGNGVTRIALNQQALAALGLEKAPAFGEKSGVGAAVSGPRGAVALAGGVCRAGPRLVLPEGVGRKLGLQAGARVTVQHSAVPEASPHPVNVEIRAGIREGVWLVDAPVGDRLGEHGGWVTVDLQA